MTAVAPDPRYELYDDLAAQLPWRDRAACLDSDPRLFFPTRGEDVEAAKAICAGCEVIAACREFAIVRVVREGVFGGLSERERRRERHLRKCALASCTNSAHSEPAPDPFVLAQERLGVAIDPRFAALWHRRRATRRASFGSGSAASMAYARALAAARAS